MLILDIIFNIIFLIVGYLIGSINFSIIFSSKIFKKDIRKLGSGNAGSTNVLRVYGKKWAILTLIIDALKSIVSILIAFIFYKYVPFFDQLVPIIAGIGAVLGHIFPIWHRFKGGKGAATLLGCFVAFNIVLTLIGFVVFIAIVFLWRYVSLGSILAPLIIILLAFIPWFTTGELGFLNNKKVDYFIHPLLMLFAHLFVIFSHKSNLVRLWNKTETKFDKSKK